MFRIRNNRFGSHVRSFTKLYLRNRVRIMQSRMESNFRAMPHRSTVSSFIQTHSSENITNSNFVGKNYNNFFNTNLDFKRDIWGLYKLYRDLGRKILWHNHHIDYINICKLHYKDPYDLQLRVKEVVLIKKDTAALRQLTCDNAREAKLVWSKIKLVATPKTLISISNVAELQLFNEYIKIDTLVKKRAKTVLNFVPETFWKHWRSQRLVTKIRGYVSEESDDIRFTRLNVSDLLYKTGILDRTESSETVYDEQKEECLDSSRTLSGKGEDNTELLNDVESSQYSVNALGTTQNLEPLERSRDSLQTLSTYRIEEELRSSEEQETENKTFYLQEAFQANKVRRVWKKGHCPLYVKRRRKRLRAKNRVHSKRKCAKLRIKCKLILKREALKIAPKQKLPEMDESIVLHPGFEKLVARSRNYVVNPRFFDFNNIFTGLFNLKNACRSWYNSIFNKNDWEKKEEKNAEDWSDWEPYLINTKERKYHVVTSGNVNLEAFMHEFEMALYEECQRRQLAQIYKLNLTDIEEEAYMDCIEEGQKLTDPDRRMMVKEDKGSLYMVTTAGTLNKLVLATLPKLGFDLVADYDWDLEVEILTKILSKWVDRGELKAKWFKALQPQFPTKYHYRDANLYPLWKTHKAEPSLRLISSFIGTFWEATDKFLDYLIQPIWNSELEKGFLLKDTKDLVTRVIKFNENKEIQWHIKDKKDFIVWSFDVVKLYPSILHEYGLEQLKLRMNENAQLLALHPSKECILDLLNVALRRGVVVWNGQHFIKRRGCGMGRSWACRYADLSLVLYDDLLRDSNWVHRWSNLEVLMDGRFRDDFFGAGCGNTFDLKCLLYAMNDLNESLQFTLDYNCVHRDTDLNGKYLEILGTKFIVQRKWKIFGDLEFWGWDIAVDVHSKDTDTHCTLQNDSCHASHQKRAIISSTALRIRSICDDQFIEKQFINYKSFLIARDHDVWQVNNVFNKFQKLSKKQALKIWTKPWYIRQKRKRKYFDNPIENKEEKIESESDENISRIIAKKVKDKLFWFVVKYHNNLPNIYNLLNMAYNNWIRTDPKLAAIFPIEKFKISYKCYDKLDQIISPNTFKLDFDEKSDFMNDALVNFCNIGKFIMIDKNKINLDNLDKWKGFMDCDTLNKLGVTEGREDCACREYPETMQNMKKWKCVTTGQSVKSNRSSCFSRDIIYAIICDNCGIPYIGKCGRGKSNNRQFKTRTREHIKDIEKVYERLLENNFYGPNGEISENIGLLALILKSIKKNYTGEVLHFLGLDGTRCYLQNKGNPLKLMKSFVLKQVKGENRFVGEAKLCKEEIFYQTQFCAISHGMNSGKDANNTGTFSRDFTKKVEQDLIDYEKEMRVKEWMRIEKVLKKEEKKNEKEIKALKIELNANIFFKNKNKKISSISELNSDLSRLSETESLNETAWIEYNILNNMLLETEQKNREFWEPETVANNIEISMSAEEEKSSLVITETLPNINKSFNPNEFYLDLKDELEINEVDLSYFDESLITPHLNEVNLDLCLEFNAISNGADLLDLFDDFDEDLTKFKLPQVSFASRWREWEKKELFKLKQGEKYEPFESMLNTS